MQNKDIIKKTMKSEFSNIPHHIIEQKDLVILQIVVVPFNQRKKGIGTKFMKRLVQLADKYKKDICLTPDDSYSDKTDMNKNQLIQWYKSFGFQRKQKDDFRVMQSYCRYANNL